MNERDLITIKAKLRLRTTNEGGRWSGIKTGYRPNHVFEYNDKETLQTTYNGEITFNKEWIQLGDNETVTVKHEGQRLVGEAEILEV